MTRTQKVGTLLENMASLKRGVTLRSMHTSRISHITPSQWTALMLVAQRGGISVKELADALHTSSSAATQLVDGLVRSGYVLRRHDARDRRTVILTLSSAMKSQVERMKSHMVRTFVKVFDALTDAEFDRYCTLTQKIVRGFYPHQR